jgi:hypothetical protein
MFLSDEGVLENKMAKRKQSVLLIAHNLESVDKLANALESNSVSVGVRLDIEYATDLPSAVHELSSRKFDISYYRNICRLDGSERIPKRYQLQIDQLTHYLLQQSEVATLEKTGMLVEWQHRHSSALYLPSLLRFAQAKSSNVVVEGAYLVNDDVRVALNQFCTGLVYANERCKGDSPLLNMNERYQLMAELLGWSAKPKTR